MKLYQEKKEPNPAAESVKKQPNQSTQLPKQGSLDHDAQMLQLIQQSNPYPKEQQLMALMSSSTQPMNTTSGHENKNGYYKQNGKYLGTDGKNEGKIFIVIDKTDVKKITKNDKAGKPTSISDINSAIELPSAYIRTKMAEAVDRSNAPNQSVGDKKGGFHEEGGIYGHTDNKEKGIDALPGPYSDTRVNKHAHIDVFSGETKNNYLEEV